MSRFDERKVYNDIKSKYINAFEELDEEFDKIL